jgi:hypothetical protein
MTTQAICPLDVEVCQSCYRTVSVSALDGFFCTDFRSCLAATLGDPVESIPKDPKPTRPSDRGLGALATAILASSIGPKSLPTRRTTYWDCLTEGGDPLVLSFDSDAQEELVNAWWLARHDFCRPCPEGCGVCHHPDHENACRF